MRAHARSLAAGLCFVLGPGLLQAQTLAGRVIDDANGRNIHQAHVMVLAADRDTVLASALAAEGEFRIALTGPGSYRLRIEGLGYAPFVTVPLDVGESAVITLEVRMLPEAIPLEPVRVVAERVEPVFMTDVRRRMRTGLGVLLAREDMEERVGSRLEDVLSDAGVRISFLRLPRGVGDADTTTGPMIPMPTGRITSYRNCYSSVFLNGAPVMTNDQMQDGRRRAALERLFDLFAMRPSDIEAIEIYRGAAQVPAEFGGSTAECGAVAFWTRSGYEWRVGDDAVGNPLPTRTMFSAGGGVYGLSGFHAPESAITVDLSITFAAWRFLGIGLYARHASHTLPARTTSFLVGEYERAPPEIGSRPMSLTALGVEPKLILRSTSRIRPALGVRAQILRRSVSITSPNLTGVVPGHHVSNGWGLGGSIGVEFDLVGRLTTELTWAREHLSFAKYPQLDTWWRRTSSTWTAWSLRFGLGVRM